MTEVSKKTTKPKDKVKLKPATTQIVAGKDGKLKTVTVVK